LKTLGFSNLRVVVIVLVEAQLLYLPPAILGLLAAASMMPAVGAALGLTRIPTTVFVGGAVIAFLLAVISALPPALKVNRLQIVDALASH
jgi:putative ABC transport system permease protein